MSWRGSSDIRGAEGTLEAAGAQRPPTNLPSGAISTLKALARQLRQSAIVKTLQTRLIRHMQSEIGRCSDDLEQITDSVNQATLAARDSSKATAQVNEDVRKIDDVIGRLTMLLSSKSRLLDAAARHSTSASSSIELLGRETSSISEAINLITNISFQTHILALNASIEAAHAGEAGKGFAVVAKEVKTLAKQSREAAQSIQHTLDNLNKVVAQVTDVVSKLGEVNAQVSRELNEAIPLVENAHAAVSSTRQASETLAAASEEYAALVGGICEQVEVANKTLHTFVNMLDAGSSAIDHLAVEQGKR